MLDEPCVYEVRWGAIAWNEAAMTWMDEGTACSQDAWGCPEGINDGRHVMTRMWAQSVRRRGGAMGPNIGGHSAALSSQHGWCGWEWMKTEVTWVSRCMGQNTGTRGGMNLAQACWSSAECIGATRICQKGGRNAWMQADGSWGVDEGATWANIHHK